MGLIEGLKNLNIVRKEIKMNTFLTNWKTSIPAIIAAIANILPFIGIPVPEPVVNAITVLAVFLVGLFARDADKSSEDSGVK